MGLRAAWRARWARAVAAGERDARLRWVAVRHRDTVVLTNRGARAVAGLRLSTSADGRTVAEGALAVAAEPGEVGSGASTRVVSPLTTETLWLGVEWADPTYGPLRATLRTDVFPREER